VASASTHLRLLFVALCCATGLLLAPLASDAAAQRCAGKKVTIKGTPGDDVIVGKGASDVIDGGGGDDRIRGGRNGNDTICGGPGDDILEGQHGYDSLYGEGGDDRLGGENGSDMLDGGGGNDELAGAKGSDNLHGGSGDDRLTGFKGPDDLDGGSGNDFLDGQQGSDDLDGSGGEDRLVGDKGNDDIIGGADNDQVEGGPGDDPRLDGGGGTDIVFGGSGIDHVDGGAGDGDVIRGDGGIDTLSGGEGVNDIVSYASATRGGIVVSLATNKAKGDGHDDLNGFEDVVGSPQGDTIVGDANPNRLDGGVGDDVLDSGGGGGEAYGGPGTDSCSGFSIDHSCGPETGAPPGVASVILNQGLDGSSLVIQGSAGNNQMLISNTADGWIVNNSDPVFAGEGCLNNGGDMTIVTCGGGPALALIVVTGGPGDDVIVIDQSVPVNTRVRANGNAGNDTLQGADGDDVLEAGENYNSPDNGNDNLLGGAGNDVLYADPGADNLDGGIGDDLLVSSVVVCQGHTLDGGAGIDTVSYGRSNAPMRVQLDATGGPPGCGTPDQLFGNNESLEGSDGPDVLIGDGSHNSFLGHLGADTFIGKGGDDFIDAADGHRDRRIECGGGEDEVVRDRADPSGSGC
jgi:Ca2+-binding RTX toxin-like protein